MACCGLIWIANKSDIIAEKLSTMRISYPPKSGSYPQFYVVVGESSGELVLGGLSV